MSGFTAEGLSLKELFGTTKEALERQGAYMRNFARMKEDGVIVGLDQETIVQQNDSSVPAQEAVNNVYHRWQRQALWRHTRERMARLIMR